MEKLITKKMTQEAQEVVNELVTKPTRKISVTYTLKRLKETLITLKEAKMLQPEEAKTLAEIYNNIYKREQGEKLEL